MNVDFSGMTPREIDEAAAEARTRAEDSLLATTGLNEMTERVIQTRDQVKSQSKRMNKLSDELATSKENLRALKADQENRIRDSYSAGVSIERLMEVTNLERSVIRKALNTEPVASAEDASANYASPEASKFPGNN
jgi:flavin-binding protein dodecin